MRRAVLTILAAGLLALPAPAPSAAGVIERACLKSERRDATRTLCACIDRVARESLNAADRRLAASFFDNPDKAERIRMSKSKSHDAFWDRFTAFAERAARSCR